ncbi:outer membrane homotrimeric porin [Maridesulfovibrio ferrireducens]|uniref:outer membrane homotrimeric porin n=1 Tax=Maridesulfovibrio ferrireducens TaxID=246191 RepID=UPI001A1B39A2|nr:outer membrane homotrimeric porin [Maridesulfovibrio ferrireducens]MBI9111353.1 outer membrane homotrimeric porin [Maridesulfovibrio ferrireducens]
MKRLVTLAILATLVLGMAGTASAVDLEAKGKIQVQANIMDNSDFLSAKHNGDQEDDLNFYFRARTQFRFIANENLMGELYLQYKTRFGTNGANSGSTLGGNELSVKRAFLQYRFPETEVLVTAGRTNLDLPGAAAGNMVLAGTDGDQIIIQSPITDQIGIAAAFLRYRDNNDIDAAVTPTTASNWQDEFDVFYAALPITIDGLEATPYFAYGLLGRNAAIGNDAGAGLTAPVVTAFTKNITAWWAGTSFALTMFDPIVFKADLVYGSVDGDIKANDRSGFGADMSLAYTGFDFVKPKFVFAYTTGEDDKTDNGSERLPTIENDFAFGTYYFGGSALFSSDLDNAQQQGFWTAGLSFEGISFLDKLTHDVHFLYIKGTNDKDLIKNAGAAGLTSIAADGRFLTTKDSAFEIDFNTNYQIYDELAAIVEFGYIDMNLDKGTWENYKGTDGVARAGKDDPALKFAVGLVYEF